ncbi:MAG: hypothetical protein Q4E89_03115 [Eubacteriales bacterium]|nr:hypothetical protein [Eubacteriales bacterium]
MKCIVCEAEIAQKGEMCAQCGFDMKIPSFLSEKQYKEWLEQVVKPCQREWLRKKEILERKAEEQRKEREYKGRIEKEASCLGTFGMDFSVFVRSDGTVKYLGSNEEIKRETRKWAGIVAVSAGDFHVLGLDRGGRVLSAGKNNLNQCDVFDWKNVVQIAARGDVSAALDAKGRVYVCGDLEEGLGSARKWSRIKKIALGNKHILGLCEDGTVKSVGCNLDDQCTQVPKWNQVIDIAAGEYHSLALCRDGSVQASGSDIDGECAVESWREIVKLQGASGSSVGIDRKGRLWRAGRFADIALQEDSSVIQIVLGVKDTDAAAAALKEGRLQIYRQDAKGGEWLTLSNAEE